MVRAPLFVTRKFPPSVGGMETLALGVWRTLKGADTDAKLLAHGGSNAWLPLWLPVTVVRTLSRVLRREVDFVLAGDAVVNAVLSPVLRCLRVPHATMVMGLDVTHDQRFYRGTVIRVLRKAPLVIAISEATAHAAVRAGVPAERVRVVRLGVRAPEVGPEERAVGRAELVTRLGLYEEPVLLLTIGRLVRRKGVRWFVAEVLPRLPSNVHYLVAGAGPERRAITEAARGQGVSGRVHLFGAVDDAERELLFRGCDLFIQPNIPVDGDMEGFGLVTIEAAVRGLPVVASGLEGILDAVVDGETGVLLEPHDPAAWTETVTLLATNGARRLELATRAQRAARDLYSEAAMGRELLAVLDASN